MNEAAPRRRQARAAPALEAKVAFLRAPASYPEHPFRVEAVETHMSWVFLLDQHVYKLKKPVRYELLDFRSLQARQHYCAEELRLNRRLAPSVYLGLVPLTLDRHGCLALGGAGATVDWLVRMQRLPAGHMLDYALARGTLVPGDLRRVAACLAAFHRSLPPEHVAPEAWVAHLRQQIGSHRRALATPEFCLPPGHVRALAADQLAMLDQAAPMIAERVRAGRIVEGHGDLRPEHVCLTEPVAIIDCLEFSRSLRIVDTADEMGFLALECERLGAPTAGHALLRAYADFAGDDPPTAVQHLYQSTRATSRAVIAARHLLDETFRHSPHWMRRAGHYLQLAEQHIRSAKA
ncbi:MAG: hypothetical protein ACXWC4_05320 [Telluria sp.]